MEDLLDNADEPIMFGRFRRSASEVQDDKCKRKYKCCNDANTENMEKIHEIKKQCFMEVRNKNKADGGNHDEAISAICFPNKKIKSLSSHSLRTG